MKTSKRKFICYLLLPRFGAILGSSIYFWGGVFYAMAITRHFSFYDLALAWFCGEFLINQAKYWLNDYKDLASDRFHPRKKERVSASGNIPKKWLPALFASRTAAGLALLCWFLPEVLPFALLLPLVQIFYESVKRIPLLNASVAASGSLVRFAAGFCAVAGGWPALLPCACSCTPSEWPFISQLTLRRGAILCSAGLSQEKNMPCFTPGVPTWKSLAWPVFWVCSGTRSPNPPRPG